LRTRLQETQAELETIHPQLEQQRSANSDIENELKNIKDQLTQLERQKVESQKPSQPRDLVIAHFELSPQLRSLDQINTISIPPGTDFVSFQLELEPGENNFYRAELKPQSSNQVIWRSGKLQTRSGGKGRSAEIRIPANLLLPRWYILELSAVSGRAAGVEAGYTFKVEKK
jgi:predicted nuclease with TOPRIM domain